MKIRLSMAALLGLITVTAFAQKSELKTAREEFEKFDKLRASLALAKPSLMTAKTSIDKAAANDKTSALPETYALKGAIYASLTTIDTTAATAATEYSTALEAIKKATETDTKKENTTLIQHANLALAQYQLDNGVRYYQNKNYDAAYKAFDAARQIIPSDTTAILNTAIAAVNAKKYTEGIANYNALEKSNYSNSAKAKIYADLPTIYMLNKDTSGAVKAINEGVTKFPSDGDLRRREIEVSLQAGQAGSLITKVQDAIKADPKNKNLYYYAGLTYSQLAEATGEEMKKVKKAADKAAKAKPGVKTGTDPQLAKLQLTKDDYYNKAAEQYKKALEIDPEYYEANLNAGYVIIAPALDLYNNTQQLPVTETKLYNSNMAKVKVMLDQSKVYLDKAVSINPKSFDALTNLKSYYLAKQDNVHANEIQKKLDALPKN